LRARAAMGAVCLELPLADHKMEEVQTRSMPDLPLRHPDLAYDIMVAEGTPGNRICEP
jgi:hypothetical protein